MRPPAAPHRLEEYLKKFSITVNEDTAVLVERQRATAVLEEVVEEWTGSQGRFTGVEIAASDVEADTICPFRAPLAIPLHGLEPDWLRSRV